MRVLVGVSGGIAAYKSCELVSRLVQSGHEVRVILTPKAAEFVAPMTFRALSGHPVSTSVVDEPEGALSHIALSHWADALIIAPATASLMARLATGLADDMLSLVYLGFRGHVIMAPAMEPDMWRHPRTQANARILNDDGVVMVGPGEGRLASGRIGPGRMAEPAEVLERLGDVTAPHDLSGLRMLITAGSTWEPFDPVRLLTNPSTGLMGVLIANQAARRGARVVLVKGPSVIAPAHAAVEQLGVTTALQMAEAVHSRMPDVDIFVGAAAVSDFRPAEQLARKAPKESLSLTWRMEPNPDIIRDVAQRYGGQKLIIGFAAQTEDAVRQAQEKRQAKGLDAMVANVVGGRHGFGEAKHEAWLVTADGVDAMTGGTKQDTAEQLLDWISRRVQGDGGWNR